MIVTHTYFVNGQDDSDGEVVVNLKYETIRERLLGIESVEYKGVVHRHGEEFFNDELLEILMRVLPKEVKKYLKKIVWDCAIGEKCYLVYNTYETNPKPVFALEGEIIKKNPFKQSITVRLCNGVKIDYTFYRPNTDIRFSTAVGPRSYYVSLALEKPKIDTGTTTKIVESLSRYIVLEMFDEAGVNRAKKVLMEILDGVSGQW